MSPNEYLRAILAREQVDNSLYSPVRGVITTLLPTLAQWAGSYLVAVQPSGSFSKGTANQSGTDIDVFVSVSSTTPDALKQIYGTLVTKLTQIGYLPRQQNVSIGITVNGYSVDVVPAKRQGQFGDDHSLYRRKADTWTKTNVTTHISLVSGSGRLEEIRVVKLWRNQKCLDFPSFYLELAVLEALRWRPIGAVSDNVWQVFTYLRDTFPAARFVDPANTNNVISDDLTAVARTQIKAAATLALQATNWNQIVV